MAYGLFWSCKDPFMFKIIILRYSCTLKLTLNYSQNPVYAGCTYKFQRKLSPFNIS